MSNCYQRITANISIPCSPLLYDRLQDAWNKMLVEVGNQDREDAGFDLELHGGQLYIYAEEFGNPDQLSKKVLCVIGDIITRAGLPHLEFGAAYYDDKPRPHTCGGFRFRIHRDGSIEYAKVTWKRSEKQ